MRKETAKQRGGTLLGVVIGLVVGLAIALVVALMITKSPVPFNNKGKDKPAISNVTPSADPNQPMYRGKDAAREGYPAKALEAQAAKPEAADKAEAKGENTASKQDDRLTYYLQTGAFKNSSEAEGMRARLALLGFEAGISEMITQNGTIFRVRIGPFTQAETMDRMRAKLATNGIEAAATRIQK